MNLHIAFCTCNFALIWGIHKHETLSKSSTTASGHHFDPVLQQN